MIGKYLTREEIDVLNNIDEGALNAIENLFHLGIIEDRYTEKDVILDACFYIKIILHKCASTQN